MQNNQKNHNFLAFAKLKFDKGAKKHQENWKRVDHRRELMDECYDGHNYANGAAAYNNPDICQKIQGLFITAWQLARELQTNPVAKKSGERGKL